MLEWERNAVVVACDQCDEVELETGRTNKWAARKEALADGWRLVKDKQDRDILRYHCPECVDKWLNGRESRKSKRKRRVVTLETFLGAGGVK